MIGRNIRLSIMLGLAASMLAVGCGPDPKQQKIAELQGEIEKLTRDLNDRDKQLSDMTGRDDEAARAVRDLNKELADLREKLAKGQPGGEIGDMKWIGMHGFDMIIVPGEVLFDSGKATLRPAGRTTLDKIASDIRGRFPDRDIYIVGHTDNDPIRKSSWKDNWELGAQRALAASRELIRSGVSPSKVIQANRAEFSPRGDNSSASGKQQNRRVEFYAVEKHGTAGTEGEPAASR